MNTDIHQMHGGIVKKIYLFDWGDTLMVNFPDAQGKMCDWERVEAVEGAHETLGLISQHTQIYIATGADDSSEADIRQAFERVDLAQYISGYFCKANLGISKGSAAFYSSIMNKLNTKPNQAIMVGDTIDKDITPALQAGLNAIWFNLKQAEYQPHQQVKQIHDLRELCIKDAVQWNT